jgi:Fic/DOC family
MRSYFCQNTSAAGSAWHFWLHQTNRNEADTFRQSLRNAGVAEAEVDRRAAQVVGVLVRNGSEVNADNLRHMAGLLSMQNILQSPDALNPRDDGSPSPTLQELRELVATHAALASRGAEPAPGSAEATPRGAAESKPISAPAADPYVAMQAAFDAPLPAGLQSHLNQRWERIDRRAQQIARQVDLKANTALARAINEALAMPRVRLASSHYPQRVGQQRAVESIENWQIAEATVLNALRTGTPITAANIKLLNSVFGRDQPQPVVRGVPQRLGEYRTVPMTPSGFPNRHYLPPELIERAMNDFERWYVGAETSRMRPLRIAAQAYARLGAIHPFPDANGRTARHVMNWILRSHGLPPAGLAPEHMNRALDARGNSVVMNPGALEQELTSAVEHSLDTVEDMLRPPPPRARGRGFGK